VAVTIAVGTVEVVTIVVGSVRTRPLVRRP
jgi:hypothetical protein